MLEHWFPISGWLADDPCQVCIAEHSELQPTLAGLWEDDPMIYRPLDVAQ